MKLNGGLYDISLVHVQASWENEDMDSGHS
jgi:hypothetical protein